MSFLSHAPTTARRPLTPRVVHSVGTSGKRASSCLSTRHSPACAFFSAPPTRPVPGLGAGGRPANSGRWGDKGESGGGDKTPASPSRSPEDRFAGTDTWPIPHRSSWLAAARNCPALLSPRPQSSGRVSLESVAADREPTGSATLAVPTPDNSATITAG